ncbi:MAG: electron transport complex subunit RsxC [Gammaproteobacteria bacterium]|jgi:electron transport complex protein RnfC
MPSNHVKSFLRGIHLNEHKDETSHQPIQRFPFAPLLILPLKQNIGQTSKPVVRQGQEVARGQLIAEPDGDFSVALHAPESGIIKKLELVPSINGTMEPGIYLQSYPGSTQEVLDGKPCDWQTATPEQIVEAIQNAGIVGLGGAAFPTHAKLIPPEDNPVDTLIINGAECEPYLTTDHRVMLEQTADILMGIRYLKKATGATKAIIGVESNKPDAYAALCDAAKNEDHVSVEEVTTKYPQGAAKMLIKALTGREVPSGKHTFVVGTIVCNVATTAEIGRLLPRGRGIQERVITVGGPAVRDKGNYRIPIGTPLRFLLETVGVDDTLSRVFLGGPMMGIATPNLDISISKGICGVIAFTEKEIPKTTRVYRCIHCGYCIDACPMGLNPSKLALLAIAEQYEDMAQRYHLKDCFECGACSFVCPSHIPLVQHFRTAKSILKKPKVTTSAA